MARNPVMFVVEIGSVLTTILFFTNLGVGDGTPRTCSPALVAAWLWFTVLFANFAEAVAEGRGKAQADTLRKTAAGDRRARAACPTARIDEVVEPPAAGRRRVRRRRPAR